jgi:uncharacterized phage protein (TIGR01671 family)
MEIKIRLFDKINKKMYYDGELENGELVVMGLDGKLQFTDTGTYKNKDFEKMLYIGLKDENGKEIYEYDIVKHSIHGIMLIEWSDYYVGFVMTHTLGFNFEFIHQPGGIEVIGNIYENPEMLEADK